MFGVEPICRLLPIAPSTYYENVAKRLDVDRLPVRTRSDLALKIVPIKYSERLAEAGIEPSVGSVGDSYDNALAEVIHRHGPWRSFEAVEFATLESVDWFNPRRLLEPVGNIPPAEAEEQYYVMLDEPAVAA